MDEHTRLFRFVGGPADGEEIELHKDLKAIPWPCNVPWDNGVDVAEYVRGTDDQLHFVKYRYGETARGL